MWIPQSVYLYNLFNELIFIIHRDKHFIVYYTETSFDITIPISIYFEIFKFLFSLFYHFWLPCYLSIFSFGLLNSRIFFLSLYIIPRSGAFSVLYNFFFPDIWYVLVRVFSFSHSLLPFLFWSHSNFFENVNLSMSKLNIFFHSFSTTTDTHVPNQSHFLKLQVHFIPDQICGEQAIVNRHHDNSPVRVVVYDNDKLRWWLICMFVCLFVCLWGQKWPLISWVLRI